MWNDDKIILAAIILEFVSNGLCSIAREVHISALTLAVPMYLNCHRSQIAENCRHLRSKAY
jgi:hypothetical protein